MRITSIIIITMLFLSCTYYQNSYLGPSANTNVILSSNKFKVIGSVAGYADAQYVFFITKNNQNLYTIAREELMAKAKVYGQSRAIINFTIDKARNGFFPFYYKDKIYMSGEIVEFVDTIDSDSRKIMVPDARTFTIKPGALCQISTTSGMLYNGIIDLSNEVYTIIIDAEGKKQVIKTKEITNYSEN